MDVLGSIATLVGGVGTGAVGFILIRVIAAVLAVSTAAMLHRK